jgi:hypothetical protein
LTEYIHKNEIKGISFCIIIFYKFFNIFDEFGGQFFQQVVGIPIGASCATLPVDLFLNSYETEFMQKLIKNNNTEANAFNLIFKFSLLYTLPRSVTEPGF